MLVHLMTSLAGSGDVSAYASLAAIGCDKNSSSRSPRQHRGMQSGRRRSVVGLIGSVCRVSCFTQPICRSLRVAWFRFIDSTCSSMPLRTALTWKRPPAQSALLA